MNLLLPVSVQDNVIGVCVVVEIVVVIVIGRLEGRNILEKSLTNNNGLQFPCVWVFEAGGGNMKGKLRMKGGRNG